MVDMRMSIYMALCMKDSCCVSVQQGSDLGICHGYRNIHVCLHVCICILYIYMVPPPLT